MDAEQRAAFNRQFADHPLVRGWRKERDRIFGMFRREAPPAAKSTETATVTYQVRYLVDQAVIVMPAEIDVGGRTVTDSYRIPLRQYLKHLEEVAATPVAPFIDFPGFPAPPAP